MRNTLLKKYFSYFIILINNKLSKNNENMRNENEKSFSVEGRMEIVFSLSPYLLKQIFNAVPLIKPLIICRFR